MPASGSSTPRSNICAIPNDKATFDKILRPACQSIIDGYRRGTRYHIKMDEADGLISQGDEHTQLTWMDAKCGNVAFTPRQGKAVEINALWYHALRLMGDEATAKKVADSFQKAFWINAFAGLADVVDGTPGPEGYPRRDLSLRPNQIFAASLPNSPLSADQQRAVVEVVRRELLTPMGLRSLAKGDSRYCPYYYGDQFQRDACYHNGTVWAWLLRRVSHCLPACQRPFARLARSRPRLASAACGRNALGVHRANRRNLRSQRTPPHGRLPRPGLERRRGAAACRRS